ncbi:uncharacterized protein LOC132047419 [Lycium ferocissimum]|uniref:uncharacterized protein LOC132047419 n=1 Tax=Lycium ferocissimum TaxID=112874 RepID=UPI0028155761|nr:uncharacterized protein LOC132047419 [Lycium ferocissimum]
MALYEALYERKCRSLAGWFEIAEVSLFGPEFVHQAIEKAVHLVFHTSMLREYMVDPFRVVPVDAIQVTESWSYEEEPVAILDRQVCRLRIKDMVSVKVLWRSEDKEDMTWEAKAKMKSKYPHLFLKDDADPGKAEQNPTSNSNAMQGTNYP